MKIKKDFTLRKVMNQNLIIAEGSAADTFNKLLILTDSAALIWNTVKKRSFTLDDAAAALLDAYDVTPEQARADAADFIGCLDSYGILTD